MADNTGDINLPSQVTPNRSRWDEATQAYVGPLKGDGWLGPLIKPGSSPHNPTVMSEYSIDDEINGQPVQYPSIVPTLSKSEVQSILNSNEEDKLPDSVYRKAKDFATQRLATGQSPFAGPGEQHNLYPELPRAPSAMTIPPPPNPSVRDMIMKLLR
jgi:hypothetical protein